jgi:hypothetical protein
MHLIGLGLEPLKKPSDPIKILGALQNRFLLRTGKPVERNINGDVFTQAKRCEILEFHAAVAPCSPGLNGSLLQRKTGVRNYEVQINVNGSPKAATGFTGPERAVKGKQIGLRRCVEYPAVGAFKTAAEGKVTFRENPKIHSSFSMGKGLLHGIRHPLKLGCSPQKTIRYNMNQGRMVPWIPRL